MPEKYDISNYLRGDGNGAPICREERQYAVLLYYAFLAKQRNMSRKDEDSLVCDCLQVEKAGSLSIHHVFFEATILRDYRYVDTPSITEALDIFCDEHAKKDGKGISPTKLKTHLLYTKPDMAVFYSYEGRWHLAMIECKYMSKIRKYDGYSQTVLQMLVCEFLCQFFKEHFAIQYTAKNTKLIRFHFENPSNIRDGEIPIDIQKLLDLYVTSPCRSKE